MELKIRTITEEDNSVLEHFLYEAIFIPPGFSIPPRSIINKPELQVYIKDFGTKKDDIGLIAEINNKPIGVVWTRIMNDYDHIDNETPSLAISLLKEFRGFGIGTILMDKILCLLKEKGYKQVSLSVQKANKALRLYKKFGFKIIIENEDEYIMLYSL